MKSRVNFLKQAFAAIYDFNTQTEDVITHYFSDDYHQLVNGEARPKLIS